MKRSIFRFTLLFGVLFVLSSCGQDSLDLLSEQRPIEDVISDLDADGTTLGSDPFWAKGARSVSSWVHSPCGAASVEDVHMTLLDLRLMGPAN